MDTSSIESYNSDDEINMDLEDYNYDTSDNLSIGDCIGEAADSHTIDIKVKSYTILTQQDIKERQENDITEVSNLLQVSTQEACLLLLHYNWSVSKVHEQWYGDEEKVRKAVGIILHTPKVYSPRRRGVKCGICFDYFSCDGLESAGCGHLYCYTCWGLYIMTRVNDGPGCLLLRCPEPKCRVAIGRDMIDSLAANEEDKERYCGFLLRSYVESNRKMKWCPAPGCELAVEFVIGSESCDVTCTCSHWFCWHCAEEPHRPVDCETVGKWILKNSSEAENTTWILANCKPCPKCKRSIEKNHGCMHMTCRAPCFFQFCWLCLGDWSNHGDTTGGYYACNRYTAVNVGSFAQEERQREMAKQCLERYAHYYERWASNNLSRQRALQSLKEMETVRLEELGKAQDISYDKLTFVLEAWKQIVECRRVLKWTYTYGYYLHDKASESELKLFQYTQGLAEESLERLHSNAEEELMKFMKADEYGIVELSEYKFMDFRTKLVDLTRFTGNHFDRLVRALENGLMIRGGNWV